MTKHSETGLYNLSSDKFFPHLGVKLYPQDNPHELPVDVAEKLMASDPNILKPARQTTQARPSAVRSETKKRGRRSSR